eukprot:CAMPEP_0202072922 /NCGR_PEP_ID=MMETSP0964-20121228/2731_1 /ASSEMBLY_ACC=CAM_ASM_000500 /TAXON_ID=4773 /ORGANISM="Schizochytrium aggregatum, Strain ATCC28209" /LENGTH=77 /DNA_ID=CAMNT_0048639989 /DNA_START=44 /DNA_END=273 /DNA_ORIENTATION=-
MPRHPATCLASGPIGGAPLRSGPRGLHSAAKPVFPTAAFARGIRAAAESRDVANPLECLSSFMTNSFGNLSAHRAQG